MAFKNVIVAISGLALVVGAGGALATPSFVNGGFEAGASTGWDLMNATNTPGWTLVLSSTFPRLNLNLANGGPYGAGNEGKQFATLGGIEDGGTSSLAQTVSGFTPGTTYTLSWIQASEFTSKDVVNVSFLSGSSTASQDFASNPYPGGSAYWEGWQVETMTFVPDATSVTFSFHTYGSNYEAGIDNFQISGGGVPEPASWAIMLVGLGGLGATLRLNRRAKNTAAV